MQNKWNPSDISRGLLSIKCAIVNQCRAKTIAKSIGSLHRGRTNLTFSVMVENCQAELETGCSFRRCCNRAVVYQMWGDMMEMWSVHLRFPSSDLSSGVCRLFLIPNNCTRPNTKEPKHTTTTNTTGIKISEGKTALIKTFGLVFFFPQLKPISHLLWGATFQTGWQGSPAG